MKIIELLNKIANGEEPKIKYDNVILKYNKNEKRFIDKDRLNSLYEIDFSELNDEVEILEEEKKIPEKLDLAWQNAFDEQVQQECIKMILENINIILDYLKSKGDV